MQNQNNYTQDQLKKNLYIGLRQQMTTRAQTSFWFYCRLSKPTVYKPDRWHLKDLCNKLQAFVEGSLINPHTNKPYTKLIINLPPRHGKTLTIQLLTEWVLGKNRHTKIITCSYNSILAGRFGRAVRDDIDQTKQKPELFIYSDIFPDTKIKPGDGSYQLWSLTDNHFNFLATGFDGTITGVGADIGLIDDPIKNVAEAYNENILNQRIEFYKDTFTQRLEEGALQIIMQHRWVENDLTGYVLSQNELDWLVIKYPAYNPDTKQMLCPDFLSYDTYLDKQKTMSYEIFEGNFNQNIVTVKGALYTRFKEYETLPRDENGNDLFERRIAYIDTADHFHFSADGP